MLKDNTMKKFQTFKYNLNFKPLNLYIFKFVPHIAKNS